MTANKLKEAMLYISNSKANEYKYQISKLSSNAINERKALTIQQKIAENTADFLKYDFNGKYYEVRESIVFNQTEEFLKYKNTYDTLNDEDKKLFLVFAYPIMLVLKTFYIPKEKLLKKACNPEKIFETKIIIGTIKEILKEWQKLWNEYGSMKCEVF